jgi:hypothetical protein
MATGRDMYAIVNAWCMLVPRWDEYFDWCIAEMRWKQASCQWNEWIDWFCISFLKCSSP